MGRTKNKPLIQNLKIVDIAAEGKAIARYEGIVVFVTQCVPGDVVDAQIIRKRKRFMEGYPVKFHEYSKDRTKPFCLHFGTCGGCKWQHLPYAGQIKFKQQQVTEMLTRIGKVDPCPVLPILPSEKQVAYRNKLEFTFSSNRWLTREEILSLDEGTERRGLGFHIPGKFDKVLDIQECHLQPEPSNLIRNFVKAYALANNIEFFDLINQNGLLRNLTIRNNIQGDVMVILSFFRPDFEIINPLLSALKDHFPQITSLMYVINSKGNDTLNDLEVKLFSGKDHLIERMEDLEFKISPKSFFQTNTDQAYKLYSTVREFAGLKGHEIVYDLYTGTGTIALFLAKYCKKIVGIEYVPEAIEDAKINTELNNVKNALFYAGDIRELMNDLFISLNGRPEVIITDPPRSGMHPDVIKTIREINPLKIVYVSCNPASQARDIELLSPLYIVKQNQPVDMFPFTHHVENVSLLEAKQ